MTEQMTVKHRIAAAFAHIGPKVANDLAFHMTDWEENLTELFTIYKEPHNFKDEQIRALVIKFLAHVPNHVAAAKKLVGLGPVEDIFGLGVLEEDD